MPASYGNWKQIDAKSAYMTTINGVTFFRSYWTIVAAYDHNSRTYFVTSRKYSVTTSKHMSTAFGRTVHRDFNGYDTYVVTGAEALEEMHWNAVRSTLTPEKIAYYTEVAEKVEKTAVAA